MSYRNNTARSLTSGRRTRGMTMLAAELSIFVPLIVVGGFLLLDAGLMSLQKQKLSFVLIQTANYLVNLPPEDDPIKPAEGLIKDLCKKSGLSYSNLNIKVEKTSIGDNEALSVTAKANFPLLQGSALPVEIAMQDTEVAIIPANRVCGAIAISPYPYSYEAPNAGISVYLPIIQPRHPMPIWQFPYETAINNLHHVQGAPPPSTPPTPKNPYFNDKPSIY